MLTLSFITSNMALGLLFGGDRKMFYDFISMEQTFEPLERQNAL